MTFLSIVDLEAWQCVPSRVVSPLRHECAGSAAAAGVAALQTGEVTGLKEAAAARAFPSVPDAMLGALGVYLGQDMAGAATAFDKLLRIMQGCSPRKNDIEIIDMMAQRVTSDLREGHLDVLSDADGDTFRGGART